MTRIANQSALVFRQLRAAWNRDCTGPRVDRLTAELAELAQAAERTDKIGFVGAPGLKKLTLGLYRAEAIPTLNNLGSYLLSRGVGLSWRQHQGGSCLLFVYCLKDGSVLQEVAGEPPAVVQVAA